LTPLPSTPSTAKKPSTPPSSSGPAVPPAPTTVHVPLAPAADGAEFMPLAPNSLEEAGVTEGQIEALILKFLCFQMNATGREISKQVGLSFLIVEKLLSRMKVDQLVVYKGVAVLGDYNYQLTANGIESARRMMRQGTYCGTAPVDIKDYIASVSAQTVTGRQPTLDELHKAFHDIKVDDEILNRVGQALHAGQGFFLHGAPGNGKTSIAERVSQAYGQNIWIPRAIGIDGQIVRLFDPCNHYEAPYEDDGDINGQKIDGRWVRIRRPAIIVGGELTMDRLEITSNLDTGVSEAPLQLKSNCGTLVIDDFGRQRMATDELLNRWIVPLDRRYDFLRLTGGKAIQVPFDQLLIFSTNLEPKDLVDEAFLRRIPYKIEVIDPLEEDFRKLFEVYSQRIGVGYDGDALEYLIESHYKPTKRPYRRCQARDLLLQVRNYCQFNRKPVVMTPANFDVAVKNYFSVMG
jgi:predicted ATPase with chaperone activity